jgi:hypothetical protein
VRTTIGFLFALFLLLTFGCATFSDSKATCLGAVDTHQEAIKLVVPHLTEAMVCAADHVDNDEAALACVHAQFEKMREHTKPIVYACALALIGDVVAAGKK